MLVLSRTEGQRIVIGDDIIITFLGNEGGRVRLGIEAPRSIPIRRSELKLIVPSVPDDAETDIALLAFASRD